MKSICCCMAGHTVTLKCRVSIHTVSRVDFNMVGCLRRYSECPTNPQKLNWCLKLTRWLICLILDFFFVLFFFALNILTFSSQYDNHKMLRSFSFWDVHTVYIYTFMYIHTYVLMYKNMGFIPPLYHHNRVSIEQKKKDMLGKSNEYLKTQSTKIS